MGALPAVVFPVPILSAARGRVVLSSYTQNISLTWPLLQYHPRTRSRVVPATAPRFWPVGVSVVRAAFGTGPCPYWPGSGLTLERIWASGLSPAFLLASRRCLYCYKVLLTWASSWKGLSHLTIPPFWCWGGWNLHWLPSEDNPQLPMWLVFASCLRSWGGSCSPLPSYLFLNHPQLPCCGFHIWIVNMWLFQRPATTMTDFVIANQLVHSLNYSPCS